MFLQGAISQRYMVLAGIGCGVRHHEADQVDGLGECPEKDPLLANPARSGHPVYVLVIELALLHSACVGW